VKTALLFLVFLNVASAQLRVGRGQTVINPPLGWQGGPEAVHDDLHAKALVIEAGGEKAAIVVCDLAVIRNDVVEAARRLIANQTGISGERVMISATHTHTAFDVTMWLDDEPVPAPMQAYRNALPGSIAEAVVQANQSLTAARVWAGRGHEDSLSFNRRFLMKDGSARMNPGKMNSEIVRPLGPIDPDVAVVYFDTPDSAPLATLVNFALHLDTVGGKAVSADYPFTLARILRDAKGPDMLTVFSIGTAGNINHIDVRSRAPQKGHGEAARIGSVLAAEVLRTYPRLQPVPAARLRAAREVVRLPLPRVAPGDVEKARALRQRAGAPGAPTFLETMWMQRILDAAKRDGRPREVEVQVIALGDDLAWVGLPGEIFVELGMWIKQSSPFPHTIVHELSSEWIRYVPNRKGYAEGGYEAINTRGAPGSGELLAEAAVRLLLAAHKGYPGAEGVLTPADRKRR
jgi:hypothetical protein